MTLDLKNPGSLEDAKDHVRRGRFQAALTALDEGGWRNVEAFVLRAEALAGLDRRSDAVAEYERIVAATHLSPAVRASALVRAQHQRAKTSRDTTAFLCELGRALQLIGEGGLGSEWAAPDDRDAQTSRVSGLAYLEAARVYAGKRARALADEAIARARTSLGESPEVLCTIGEVALAFDERLEAREAYKKARVPAAGGAGTDGSGDGGDDRTACLGLARVALLLGDFAACHATLDGFAWGEDDLEPRALRVDVLTAEQRWPEVARVLGEMIAISPHGDGAPTHALERALALYRAGARADCEAALAAIVDRPREGRDGRVAEARRTLALLRADDGARSARRLKAFPTIAQLRNHCGPASCELYLRFLGIDAHQEAIGEEILFAGGGTTFHRMRGILERAGLSVLRLEAELPRIRTLIDLGIPVILEETYSQSGHAAVAIGYDDVREVLAVQDPMTHAVRETPYAELEEILDMSNAGGLIGVAREDSARCDAIERAQIGECRYMVLVDKAFAALESAPADLDAAERLATQAIEERRDYELAWCCRFEVAMKRLAASPTAAHRLAAHHVVNESIAIWPDDDWARALAGRLALFEDRFDDARGAFERACDADPWDPANWFGLAQCAFRQQDYERARHATSRALELNPAHQDANELGAYVAVLRGDVATATVLNDCALAVASDSAFSHLVQGDIRAHRDDFEGALASYAAAIEIDPARAAPTYWRRSEFLRKLGRHDALAELFASGPPGVDPHVLRVHRTIALLDGGRAEEAATLARELEAMEGQAAIGASLLSQALAALGRHDEAEAAADRALARDATYGRAHVTKGVIHRERGDEAPSLLHLGLALSLAPDEARRAFELARALDAFGHLEEAARHYETSIRGGALGEAATFQAAAGLARARSFHAAIAVLDDVAASRVRRLEALRAKVRLLTEVAWAPGPAGEASRAIAAIDADDPFAIAVAGADRFDASIDGEAAGIDLLRRALAALGGLHPYPRRLLARRLLAIGHATEALALVPDPPADYLDADLRVDSLVVLERFDEAEAQVAAFEKKTAGASAEPEPHPVLRYTVAEARGDFEAALGFAIAAGKAAGEDAEDARLDDWELNQFRCLMALGRVEEAVRFGSMQGGDGGSLGKLAHNALLAGSLDTAKPLAEMALRLDPEEAYAIHVLGREAELRGDAAKAREYYEKTGTADPQWHAWLEEMARLAIAEGRFEEALAHADRAVAQDGHTCTFAVAVRAQARLVNGDFEGARADALRSYGLASPSDRDRVALDVWGLCRLMRGEIERGMAIWDRFLSDPRTAGPLDRARIGFLRDAFSRMPPRAVDSKD